MYDMYDDEDEMTCGALCAIRRSLIVQAEMRQVNSRCEDVERDHVELLGKVLFL